MRFVIICVQYKLIKHAYFLSGLESGNENERSGGEFESLQPARFYQVITNSFNSNNFVSFPGPIL